MRVGIHYISTRGNRSPRTFGSILLEGLAPDGGLYVPSNFPDLSLRFREWRGLPYIELAKQVMYILAPDILPEEMRRIIKQSYAPRNFGAVPSLAGIGENTQLLKLSGGPTGSFKDVALQPLGALFEHALARSRGQLTILGATSGDTGSAAEYAVRGKRGITIFMLFPEKGMSRFQWSQMCTIPEENVINLAVRGGFDDCQRVVKKVNEDIDFKRKYSIGAVNSINWTRIAFQVVYYIFACLKLSRFGERIAFAVPTGNFGNIYAGHVARMMGAPISRLILATNENDMLAEFVKTGVYRRRGGHEKVTTSSPSMDIQEASNLERLVFDVLDRTPSGLRTKALYEELAEKGSYTLPADALRKLSTGFGFSAGTCTHKERLETIRAVYDRAQYAIDPHTANGVFVGEREGVGSDQLVCLETALPVKFHDTMVEALGRPLSTPRRFSHVMTRVSRAPEVIDADPALVKRIISKHFE